MQMFTKVYKDILTEGMNKCKTHFIVHLFLQPVICSKFAYVGQIFCFCFQSFTLWL